MPLFRFVWSICNFTICLSYHENSYLVVYLHITVNAKGNNYIHVLKVDKIKKVNQQAVKKICIFFLYICMFYAVEQAKPDFSSSSSGTIVGIGAAVLGVGVIVVIVFFLR